MSNILLFFSVVQRRNSDSAFYAAIAPSHPLRYFNVRLPRDTATPLAIPDRQTTPVAPESHGPSQKVTSSKSGPLRTFEVPQHSEKTAANVEVNSVGYTMKVEH